MSVGRYSGRFLAHMAARWARGAVGFEEVALPMACVALGRAACELGTFRRLRTQRSHHHHRAAEAAHGRPTAIGEFFRYRPAWGCDDFVGAAARHTHELWHPLKRRDCWVAYLDACDASGCHAPAPPLQAHCHDSATGDLHTCAHDDARRGRAPLLPFAGWNGNETCSDQCT